MKQYRNTACLYFKYKLCSHFTADVLMAKHLEFLQNRESRLKIIIVQK